MTIITVGLATFIGAAAPAGAQVTAAGHSFLPVEPDKRPPLESHCDPRRMFYTDCGPGLQPVFDWSSCVVRCVEPWPKPRRPWHEEDRKPYRLLGERLERQAAELTAAVRGGGLGEAQGALAAAFDGSAAAGGGSAPAVSAEAEAAQAVLRAAALDAYTGRVYGALEVPAPVIIAGEKGAAAGAIIGGIGGGAGGPNASVAGAGVGGLVGSKAEDAFNKKMDELGDKLRDRNDEKLREANRQKEEAERRWPRK